MDSQVVVHVAAKSMEQNPMMKPETYWRTGFSGMLNVAKIEVSSTHKCSSAMHLVDFMAQKD